MKNSNNKKKSSAPKIRLNKYIASTGICSRRDADKLIEFGKVRINDTIIKELGFSVSPKDRVYVNNELVKPKDLTYIRYYKPAGYITSMDDEKGRKTIYDILPEEVKNLKPVGRLDKDSTGLLILTNDGELINELTHPSVKIPKIYRVCAQGKMNLNHLEQMAKGIEIEPGKKAFADAFILEIDGKNTILEVTLHQGLNRQIRKMLDILGHSVISLKRISHGPIDILGLKKGQFKYLKPKQIKDLKNYIEKIKKLSSN